VDEPPPVAFNDLARATALLRDELDAALARVLDSGWYVLGGEGAAFESEFATYCGADHAIGVGSGTDAIELALRALDIGPGDEIVTQANTCIPTISAIERAGATPVLCDVKPETATIDLESFRGAIGPRTRAVVPVHLYGQCGDIDGVATVAADFGVEVVEDCAQAHGATIRDRQAGTIGRIGCFSFYPTKNVGALGDGGAVVTDDADVAERLRRLREYGQTARYVHVDRGVNSRLDEIQAAVLRAKLTRLRTWNQRRNEIAKTYDEALAGGSVRPLSRLPDRRHVFHLYVVAAEDRTAFRAHLESQGVRTLIHYPQPVHGYPPYRALGNGPVPLDNSERLCREVVSLPMYPELNDDEVERVAVAVRSFSQGP
jgi:dTDP-4-amino-4,6-dideoxygalactose transaminase